MRACRACVRRGVTRIFADRNPAAAPRHRRWCVQLQTNNVRFCHSYARYLIATVIVTGSRHYRHSSYKS